MQNARIVCEPCIEPLIYIACGCGHAMVYMTGPRWRPMTKLKLPRRKLLFLVAAVATLSFSPGVAKAENYPSRPVRLVVGLPPGSSPDIVARLMTQWLSERLGQHFVVDNKPGANS